MKFTQAVIVEVFDKARKRKVNQRAALAIITILAG